MDTGRIFGNVLAGASMLLGILFIAMGLAGSYTQLGQFGISFPGVSTAPSSNEQAAAK